jgi:large subunit ribosomal protein L14
MIQSGTFLKAIDNSGAKNIECIKIVNGGYRQRYAHIGSLILISVKSLRGNPLVSKVKKGELHHAIIIRAGTKRFSYSFNYRNYFENSAALLSKQNKLIGTRIFGSVPKEFKYSKFLKLISTSAGISI